MMPAISECQQFQNPMRAIGSFDWPPRPALSYRDSVDSEAVHRDSLGIDLLHAIGRSMAAADPLHEVLDKVVEFISSLIPCDSCFIYVLEGEQVVLRASKNPHPGVVDRLRFRVGQMITGWLDENREPVAEAHIFAARTHFPHIRSLSARPI